jgi:hypothetical protein
MYIQNEYKETEMKIARRSDSSQSGHLLSSVPASRRRRKEPGVARRDVRAAGQLGEAKRAGGERNGAQQKLCGA